MSVEDARACLRRLIDDPAFMTAVRGADGPASRRAVVQAAGFDFTLEELAEARSLELSDEESLKISLADEEMDAVAGGGHCGSTHEVEHCGKTHESEAGGRCGWTHEAEGHCGLTHEIE